MSNHARPSAKLTVVAQFPEHFFLENIVVRHDNSLLITVLSKNALYCVPPPSADAEVQPTLLHTFDQPTLGITELEPDVFAVLSGNVYTTHDNYLHRLDLRRWMPGAPVKPDMIMAFPEAVLAVNGCCALTAATVLTVDTFAGAIWRIDVGPDGHPDCRVWLKHDSMAHIEDTLPPPPQPGINGIRFSPATGHVYYTTTGQKLFMRVPVDPATLEPNGAPEQVSGGGMYDDFCIDEARGCAYVTVHRENRIDRLPLEPGEASSVLVGDPLDPLLLGPSSAAWSRAADEIGRVIFVTSDGGHTAPPPDGVRTAKVLRLELVEAEGW